MKTLLIGLCAGLFSLSSFAATLTAKIEIPQLEDAEYHRPYVAIWIEDADRKQVAQVVIWVEKKKWHRDLRSWWRRGGNRIDLPLDGISGATRKPGTYTIDHTIELPHGEYTVNYEAAREVGGREHLRLPLNWQGKSVSQEGQGVNELGKISFTIKE